MDQLNQLIELIRQYAPPIFIYGLMGLGGLVVASHAYVLATPSPEDDKWWSSLYDKPVIGFILKLLIAFSPVEKKAAGQVSLSNKPEGEKGA